MKTPKVDMSGVARANQAIADAQAAAQNMQKNYQADLKTQNLTKVDAGGAAAAAAGESPIAKRRRSQTAGMASSLGVNI